jgi:2'-phosphotransferase
MRGIDVEMVIRLVEENAKQRFELLWGYDPSPPLPIKKKGQNKKAKSKPSKPTEPTDAVGQDAAGIDDLRKEMEASMLEDKAASHEPEWKELPLVQVDKDASHDGSQRQDGGQNIPTWFIRASQGHSIKLEGTAHLTPVEDNEEGHQRVGAMVHGTRDDLWDTIRKSTPWQTGDLGSCV